jgi:hypothetical protein
MEQHPWREYEHFAIDHHSKQLVDGGQVWHWTHIPEDELFACGWIHDFNHHRLMKHELREEGRNMRQEYGLDGLAKTSDGIYQGLQMKCWDGRRRLTANDIGSFMSTIVHRMWVKNQANHGVLYHTCRLETNLEDDLKNNPTFVRPVHLSFATKAVSDAKAVLDETKLALSAQQKEALKCLADEDWDGPAVLWMPPGTGKTLVFANHAKSKYHNVVILSPLQVQANQTFRRVKPFLDDKDALVVDCEAHGTRDVNQIREAMKKGSLISATYDSVDVLLESAEELLKDSLLIIDEAHNIAGKADMKKIMTRFPRTLLVSGTPPNKYFEDEEEPPVIYHYAFRDAIAQGHITDYTRAIFLWDSTRWSVVPATTTTRKLLCRTAQAPVLQLGTRLCKPNLMLGEALYADYALMIVVTSVRMQVEAWVRPAVSQAVQTLLHDVACSQDVPIPPNTVHPLAAEQMVHRA